MTPVADAILSDVTTSIVWDFLPRAQNLCRIWYRNMGGDRRGIELEDCIAQANLVLAELAKKYDDKRASVVACLALFVPRHLNKVYMRQLRGDFGRLAHFDEEPELPASPNQERATELARLREWASKSSDRQRLLQALDDGAKLDAHLAELLREARRVLNGQRDRRAYLRIGEASRRLGTSPRALRAACDRGTVPSVRDAGWLIAVREVRRLRREKLRDHLQGGATVRAAAAQAGVSVRTAHKELRERRRPGPRPRIDTAAIRQMLTDRRAAPDLWRGDRRPSVRAVAAVVGCSKSQVADVARALPR